MNLNFKSVVNSQSFNPSNRSRLFKVLFWIVGGVFLLLVHSFIVFLMVAYMDIMNLFFFFSPKAELSGVNIMAFGIDDVKDSKRSDAILVFHLDHQKNYIGALSIPRDTRVNVKGVGRTRINHAYSHGGVTLLKESVSEFLGVPLDYYVKLDLSGVGKLVDLLGGVSIHVKKNLNYIDYAGGLVIDIKKGQQLMDGKKAMQYLRFRHDEEGDIGRIRRQQEFLHQMAIEVASFDSLVKLPKIIEGVKSMVTTDLSMSQMLGLALQFKGAVNEQNISKGTVPGHSAIIGGAYYWKPNITALDETIDHVLLGFRDQKEQVVANKSFGVKTESLDHFASSQVSESPIALTNLSKEFDQKPLKDLADLVVQSSSQKQIIADEVTQNIQSTEQVHETVSRLSEDRRSLYPQEVKRVIDAGVLYDSPDFEGISCEILNGIGKNGIAKQAAKVIKALGVKVPRFANAGHFEYSKTILVDWHGNADKALELAALLEIDPKHIIVYDKLEKPLRFTLVLGQDWLEKKELLAGIYERYQNKKDS